MEDHIITAGPVTYEFDYDDNLAARIEDGETTEYFYAATGELMRVNLSDGRVISYVHDPLGRRIAKKIDGTVVEKYLWSGRTTLLAVYDGSGNLIQRFEYADGRMPVAMTMNNTPYYLAYDQVGSLRVITDSSGNIVKRIDYDSFGNIIVDSNPSFSIPFGFAGGLHDRDTGLVRFGYRDYLPEIGKWTAKDPIDFSGGDSNLYGYVENDPVNWVDPWGLAASEIRNSPGFADRVKDKLRTDWDRVKNPDRYGENARSNTVMTYTGAAITTGAIGAAGAWKYGLQYSPYIGTAVGKAAYDYWGTGQPGWFALKDRLQGYWEDLKDRWKDKGSCETN